MSHPMHKIFLNLEITDGEREYNSLSVHQSHREDYQQWAREYAASFYGDSNSDTEEAEGGYYQVGGEVHVKVYDVRVITDAEYATLKRFL